MIEVGQAEYAILVRRVAATTDATVFHTLHAPSVALNKFRVILSNARVATF